MRSYGPLPRTTKDHNAIRLNSSYKTYLDLLPNPRVSRQEVAKVEMGILQTRLNAHVNSLARFPTCLPIRLVKTISVCVA
jgi:hypothetical protein